MRSERGSALISSIVVSAIVMSLGITGLALSVHTNDVSAIHRSRIQNLHAADGAISDVLHRFTTNFNTAGVCSPANSTTASTPVLITDAGSNVAKFRYRVEPVPADPGYPGSCTINQRVIRAWGYSPVSNRAGRQIEITVKVTPISGFHYALFAGGAPGTLSLRNNADVEGSVYAESFSAPNNDLTISSGDLVSPGAITTKNNSSYAGNITAGGTVTLGSNNLVKGFVRAASAGSGVTLGANTVVDKIVSAGSAITPWPCPVPNTCTQNSPSSAPASIPLPTFTYNASNYTSPVTFTTVAAANAYFAAPLPAGLSGTFYVTDPSPSALKVSLKAPWKITGPVTIVADKCGACTLAPKIEISGTTWTSTGTPTWQFVLISTNTDTDAVVVASPQLTLPNNLATLFFTPGGIDVGYRVNNYVGSMYASRIDAKNNLQVRHSSELANNPPPGFTFPQAGMAQWSVEYLNWRELAPGPLPAGS